MTYIAAHLNAKSVWRWQCSTRDSFRLSRTSGTSVPASTLLQETTHLQRSLTIFVTNINFSSIIHNHRFCSLQVWCPIVFASSGHHVLLKFGLQGTLFYGGGGFTLASKDFGRMFDHSPPAFFFFFFFNVEISSHTLIPLFMLNVPWQVAYELFPDRFPHYVWTAA